MQSPVLHRPVRVCSSGVKLRSARNTKSVISFLTGSNNRLSSSCWREVRSIHVQRGPASRSYSLCLSKGKSPQSASGMGERFCRGRDSSGLLWAHFSVTCGNSPLCSAHQAGNIFLEFFQNTLQVWGQDNGPVGGGPGAGARLLGSRGSLGFQHDKAKSL